MQFGSFLPGPKLFANLKEYLCIVRHGIITRRSPLQSVFSFTSMGQIFLYTRIYKTVGQIVDPSAYERQYSITKSEAADYFGGLSC